MGAYSKSFNFGLTQGWGPTWGETLKHSNYFVRHGEDISTCSYIVGNVRLIPETLPEQYNGVLRAQNANNDVLGEVYPGVQSLAHYQRKFTHIIYH